MEGKDINIGQLPGHEGAIAHRIIAFFRENPVFRGRSNRRHSKMSAEKYIRNLLETHGSLVKAAEAGQLRTYITPGTTP